MDFKWTSQCTINISAVRPLLSTYSTFGRTNPASVSLSLPLRSSSVASESEPCLLSVSASLLLLSHDSFFETLVPIAKMDCCQIWQDFLDWANRKNVTTYIFQYTESQQWSALSSPQDSLSAYYTKSIHSWQTLTSKGVTAPPVVQNINKSSNFSGQEACLSWLCWVRQSTKRSFFS